MQKHTHGVPQRGRVGVFSLFISLGVVGFAQQIINAGVVKPRQLDQNGGGDVVFSRFVFGIARLGHSQHFGNLSLVHILVLS